MKDGFLYPIINFVVKYLDYLNLVEFFKATARALNPKKSDNDATRTYERWAVDLFVTSKWIYIIIIWCRHTKNTFTTIFVWYLLISNLYTYFYRHIWCDDAINPNSSRYIERVRRRFYNLFLAFSFSNFCFAYLYRLPYSKEYSWGQTNDCNAIHSIWFSVSNSIAANYNYVSPISDIGNNIAMIQLIITFIFITIIIGKSN